MDYRANQSLYFILLCVLSIFYSSTMPVSNLRIVQWNCRSINNKSAVLEKWLEQNPTDILLLQSLSVKSSSLPKLKGFLPPECDFSSERIQVATYVSEKIKYEQWPLLSINSTVRLYRVAVKIQIKKSKPLIIVNSYFPDGVSDDNSINWLENLDSNYEWLLAGDFNCRNLQWDPTADSNQGVFFSKKIADSNLVCLNDGSFTRIGNIDQDDTAIDLTLTSPNTAINSTWEVCDDELGSDHIPIKISIDHEPSFFIDCVEFGYNTKKADWSKFTSLCDVEAANYSKPSGSINERYESLRQCVIRSADISVPKKSNAQHFSLGQKYPLI